jgi:uncharacterized protein (TIGR02646 family)
MIKLEKGEQPQVLADNAVAWTNVVVDKLAAGEQPTKTEKGRYNHPEVKAALIAETRGKCAYCESKVRHVSYGDIEHVVPKSDEPSKWFDWFNLTLACDVCNTNKSNAPVNGDVFVDPYAVDPEEHFWLLGTMVKPKPGNEAASLTERLLDLNRVELLERRAVRLHDLLRMLEVVERAQQPVLKAVLWDDFCREAEAHKEYAALARSVVAVAKVKLGY